MLENITCYLREECLLEGPSYRDKKVMTIGTVKEMTGLSERKIRYYEKKKLLSPARTPSGMRKYSFTDVEMLLSIAEKRQEGILPEHVW